MPFDVFVSYATEDRVVANAACARLEAAGIRCWIAPRDITPGTSYGEAIIEAIHEVKVMVLVFSSNANTSEHIPKEVERAVSNSLPIIPLRIEDVAPGKRLDYFIGSIHWLDAMTPPLDRHLDALVETVQKLLPQRGGAQPVPPRPPAPHPHVPAPAGRGVSPKVLGIGAGGVVAIAVAIWAAVHFGARPNPAPAPGPVQSTVPGPVQAPAPGPTPKLGPSTASADPIVGCYHWFNNGTVVIRGNGTMTGGPFPGRWRLVSAASRAYTFTWPTTLFSVTVAANQQSLSGMNQYQYSLSATRTAGAAGLVGAWNLSNNVPVLVFPNGTLTVGNLKGTWRAVDAARGTYSMAWPGPVDSVTLSADGQTIQGKDQYGIDISGTRTEPCAVR